MYQNLKTYSPDGDLMFLANKKKINWYLDRGLAVKIDDSSIKLTFEPKGSGEKIIPLIDRENICVVCGTIDDLTHHHVVPTVIKKRLPLEYREHSSYDVVLMCVADHRKYEKEAMKFKKFLIQEYIPDEYKKIENFNKAIGYKAGINKRAGNIPPEKLSLMKAFIDEIVSDFNLISVDEIIHNNVPDVYKILINEIGIEPLILKWRHHFVEKSDSKFLPDWWVEKMNFVFKTHII